MSKSQFDELLGELETLAKAQPAEDGDDKIVAAAAEGGGQGEGESEGEEDGADVDDDGKPMAKSFKVTLADGSVVDAQDGTELVKALQDRVEATEGVLAKALQTAVGLIKSQGEQIASLAGKVKALGVEGKGRKAVLSVVEKPQPTTLAKSEPAGIAPEEFMLKALDAQKMGRITGLQVAVAEANLNRGQPVPADIIERVLKA